jgi:uncharacterized membrane protein
MSEAQPVLPASDITDQDKLIAALSYLLTPIVGIIVLLVDNMKARPYQKYHALQSIGLFVGYLAFTIVACILTTVCGALLTMTGVGAILAPCLSILFFLPIIASIYYAIIAYTKPTYFEIPILGPFMKQQGWLSA